MKAMTVRLPDELGEKLDQASYETRQSQAAIVHRAVEAELIRLEESQEWTPGERKAK